MKRLCHTHFSIVSELWVARVRGISPTVREGSMSRALYEPFLTVGLVPRSFNPRFTHWPIFLRIEITKRNCHHPEHESRGLSQGSNYRQHG